MQKSTPQKRRYSLREKSSKHVSPPVQKFNAEEGFTESWTAAEIAALTEGILTHGHLSKRVLDKIPRKRWSSYVKMFTQAKSVGKNETLNTPMQHILSLNKWITKAEGDELLPRGPLNVALLLKLLSIDGIVENHPLPQEANGVDFGACYRLMYQAILGHPLQPLNQASHKLFFELFTDITKNVDTNRELIQRIGMFVHDPLKTVDISKMYAETPAAVKEIKSYSRKKPTVVDTNLENEDVLKETFENKVYNPLQFPLDLMDKSVVKPSTNFNVV